MRILLVGSLSWNPERFRALAERGHELLGLWSRSMPWDQGPYPALDGCVRRVRVGELAEVLSQRPVDCVYGLFQVYGPEQLAPPSEGVEDDVWTLLRRVFDERARGTFDAPIVFHFGFDVHVLDLGVVRALDARIHCNEEQLRHWSGSSADGGCGLDLGSPYVVGFLDSDRPLARFMNEAFTEPLSDQTGEIHTACIGRPLGIDVVGVARSGVHLHLYGNNFDDVEQMLVRGLRVGLLGGDLRAVRRFVHVHPTRQLIGAPWDVVDREKSRWVQEFSRYDAGWSYIGTPLPWSPLADRAAIPNRLSTYLLAGLPVITDHRPGWYRYDELVRLGVNVDLRDGDYRGLRRAIESEVVSRRCRDEARSRRRGESFDALVDPLLALLERARQAYFAAPPEDRRRLPALGRSVIRPGEGTSDESGRGQATSPRQPAHLRRLVRSTRASAGRARRRLIARRLAVTRVTSEEG